MPSSPIPHWYCLRSQPKHEHVAAAALEKECGLEVYLPRIRFRRATRRGPVWFTEPLFPSYLFARFCLQAGVRRIHHTRGVLGIVHFGERWPWVAEEALAELRAAVPGDRVHLIEQELQPGDPVEVCGGAFHGLRAVVARLMPAQQRVAVLLEFLGRQTYVELPASSLISEDDQRVRVTGRG